MEIQIRYQLNDDIVIQVDVNFKNFKHGVSVNIVIEQPLIAIFQYIAAFQQTKDPKIIKQLQQFSENLNYDFRQFYPFNQLQQLKSIEERSTSNTLITKQIEINNSVLDTSSSKETKKQLEEVQTNNISEQPLLKTIQLFKPAYAQEITKLVTFIRGGFDNGFEPDLCEEGINGTYFLKDKNGAQIAVFKPQDEEGNSLKNPKNQLMDDIQGKGGIHEGEASQREVAAFLLDKHKFFGVPATQMAFISHPYFETSSNKANQEIKIGSLQEFVSSEGCCEEISVSLFPKHEVHKIGILDLQILNMDRHGGNILFRKSDEGEYKLIPIDHGFSLPDNTGLGNAWFDWLTWPQAKEKFDEETKKYVENIDLEDDLATLERELNIRKDCLNTMKITTTLLKKAVAQNLTLHDIGMIVCRKTVDLPSDLEIMCQEAKEKAKLLSPCSIYKEETYLNCLFQIMDETLARKLKKK